jgi:hypothetical protein
MFAERERQSREKRGMTRMERYMKGFKPLSACLVAVLVFVVLPTAALAAGKVLILTNEGKEVPNGASADVGLFMGGCVGFSEGIVAANHAAKDKVTATKNGLVECSEAGESESGVISEAQLATSGKISLIGKISITKPGPCIYEFSKFTGKFTVPGTVLFEGSTSGKLNKTGSAKTCAKKVTETYEADVTNSVTLEPFNAEL